MKESILCIGDKNKEHVVFGPLTVDEKFCNFVMGPIEIKPSGDSNKIIVDNSNGIERSTIAMFRSDLFKLLQNRSGHVFFGNHDYGQIVEMKVEDGFVSVLSEVASLDKFDMNIGKMSFTEIEILTDEINKIEKQIGPLVGHCEGCGEAISRYYPESLP